MTALRYGVLDTWTLAQRSIVRALADPRLLLPQLAFPIMFVLLYGYVFGSGMTVPGGGDYVEFLMPGLFVQMMAFGLVGTMSEVAADAQRGITDRFRVLPISAAAVVLGRGLADMLSAVVVLAIMLVVGLLMGWEWHGGALDAAAAFGLLLLLRFALVWVGIYLGLVARSPEAASGLFLLAFPVTMITSAFVAPELMPDWLGAVAEWNPLSATITATRTLFDNPGQPAGGAWPTGHAALVAILGPALLTAVFLPLSARRYRRMSR